jgi:hypothetical protein
MARRVLFVLWLLVCAAAPGRADDAPPAPPAAPPAQPAPDPTLLAKPSQGQVSLYAEVALAPHGDADGRVEIHFEASDFARVKAANPDPRKFLQDVHGARADYETGGEPKAGYDDEAQAVVLLMRELGAAKHLGGGRWSMHVEEGGEILAGHPVEGRLRAVISTEGEWAHGVKFSGKLVYLLPPGAQDANWDKAARLLTWTLPLPEPTGPGALGVAVRVKDRLMTTIYKVYGLKAEFAAQWVAKGVLTNTGGSVLKNVRIRFRLDRYAEWSAWTKVGEMVPGQTVVAPYYPVLDASIARLRSNTPADLRVEWSYTDEKGQRVEDDDSGRVVLLGGGEFVFSNLSANESFGTWQEAFNNAPLLAAWVSRDDPVVKRMAAMANRLAGGLGATENDRNAVLVLAACYDLLRANDFTYQHPATLADKSISFDVRQVQHVKLPRDVIRDRSGTCIDLAILLAAMGNAVGLEPYLALIPGHCFPVFRLPGGNLQPLESTGVAGGLRYGSADAMTMFTKGEEELKAAFEDGRITLVDVRSLWTQGISNPELDELPAGILETWGIREEGRGSPTPGTQPAAPVDPNDPIPGIWGGSVTQTDEEGESITFPVRVGIDPLGGGKYTCVVRADVELAVEDGQTQKIVILEQGEGQRQGDEVLFKMTARKVIDAATNESEDMPARNRMLLRVKDGKLEGKHGSDDEGWTFFSLARER